LSNNGNQQCILFKNRIKMKNELNLFTRWLIKHYSTSHDEDGSFCYKNAMGEIVEIIDIVNYYMEEQGGNK
jgi:hypothetical protein